MTAPTPAPAAEPAPAADPASAPPAPEPAVAAPAPELTVGPPAGGPASWWRRNRLALGALVVLVPLAGLSASSRMVTSYLPWQYNRPHVSADGSPVHLQRSYTTELGQVSVDVTVHVVGVRTAVAVGDFRAAPGSRLWVVDVGFEAPPDSMLQACEVTLVDAAGNRYATNVGQIVAERGTFSTTTCVPKDATGPVVALPGFPAEWTPRPPTWGRQFVVAVPESVRPVALRIGWHKPDYVELPLPAS